MATQGAFLFSLLIFSGLLASTNAAKPSHYSMPFNRSSFPHDFTFGAGTAAYQSEGAAYIDGKGQSIWDTFTKNHPGDALLATTPGKRESRDKGINTSSTVHKVPKIFSENFGLLAVREGLQPTWLFVVEKIWDHSAGSVAIDFYHRYKEDIQLMKKIGLDSFRFSISWPRVLPKGKLSGGVNPLGVKFYNNLINELLANGITPFVTLFHWDLPQALDDEYSGFLSSKIVDDFRDFADFAFKTFGDRVKHWCTMNEPYIYSANGYNGGTFAPGRCSKYSGNCTLGNSATEPYTVAHNLLLAHAAAVKVYREKYQASQKGKIGISIVTHWFIPKSPKSLEDRKAASRALDFMFGWSADPLTYGDYPEVMKSLVGNRLPKFTKEQSELVKGSMDFLAVNYYTTHYAANNPSPNKVNFSYSGDSRTITSTSKAGHPIGQPTASKWLFIYPVGIYELMLYIRDKYKNPPIYITENGVGQANNASEPIKVTLKDGIRIRYHSAHLQYLLRAIKEGVNVKGYYQWAFWDDFEWDAGFTVRFGLVYIDFKNNLKRYLKYSAYWFKMFLLH